MRTASLASAVAAVLLLSACATVPDPGAGQLAGTWVMMADDLEFPLACASGLPITYAPDGTYGLLEERGTWRLEGDRLIETATEATPDATEGAAIEIGVPYRSTLRWIDRDAFRKTFADGSVETFRRCPAEGP